MKKSLLLVLFSLAASCAQAGMPIEHWVADSGAKVVFVRSTNLPMLDVQVDFAAGGAFVPAGKSGLAGLTQGLLDAGAGHLDEEAIADVLTDSGAQLGGSADADRAGLSVRTLTAERERVAALTVLRLLLQSPTFPESVLAREKSRLIASIKEGDTQPGTVLAKRFATRVYGNHPYGQHATEETLAAITRDDVLAFYRANYCANRAVVSMVGDVTRVEAERIAQMLTDGLPRGCTAPVWAAPTLPAGGVERVDHAANQSHIAVGLPALRRGDADFFPLTVGNYVLGGGGFVSRMMKEVREKRGYAYSAYSYFAPQKVDGLFQISLQTKADQADAALKVARDTLDAFLAKGPTEDELQAAKRNLINGFVLRIDSNRKLLDHLAVIGFYGLPLDYLDTYSTKVAQVTAPQIRDAFARRIKPDHLITVIVGPTPRSEPAQ